MKKLIFILIGIIFSLSTFAQRVAFNKSVAIDMPKELQKVTKEQAQAHANEKFKGNKALLSFSDIDTTNSRLYKVDDVIIQLRWDDTIVNFEPGYAAALKKGQDALGRKQLNYTSSLKVINGNTVVVINNIVQGTGYSFFYCFNASNTRSINGRLVYNKKDKDKVPAIMDHILNGIKFKD